MIVAPVNTPYMVAIFATMTLSSFSVGFALGGYNQSSFVVETLTGWQHSVTTLITSSGVFGLMIGALFCDKVLPYGRLKAALIANTLIIIGCIPQMFITIGTLIAGRFLLGLGSGLFTVICSVYMAETIPSHLLSLYGTAVNLGIVVGLLVAALIQGSTLPSLDQVSSSTVNTLRLNFAAPGVFAALSMFMFICMLKKDSLYYLIEQQQEDAIEQFKRIYIWTTQQVMNDEWALLKLEHSLLKKAESPSLKEIFLDRRFATCTVFLILASIINQCSGINAINIYSTEILKEIPSVPTTVGVYMLSAANVVGAMLGPIANRCVSIRGLIIGGQFLMALFLGLIVVFQLTGFPTLILISMILMITTYQITIGSYYFVYVSQVAIETQNSVAVFVLWTLVLIFSLITSSLIAALGIAGTFTFFASTTLIGGLYFIKMLKSTQGLSSAECKQVYYPDDLKSVIQSDVKIGESENANLIGKFAILNDSEISTPTGSTKTTTPTHL